MTPHQARILIVDDEPFNVEIILEYLEECPYELESAVDGQEAWNKLEAEPDRFDVVLLDRMMPYLNGMEVLQRIKAHPVLQSVPVILQTALASKDEVVEGLRAGAYYYLTKPFDEEMLLSVISTAVEDRLRYRRSQNESAVAGRTLGLLSEGRFFLKSIDSARDLANVLAHAFPRPQRVVVGLSELLLNAVEHGNLGISYDEKSKLKEENEWENEIARRMSNPAYRDREVEVLIQRLEEVIRITITDQGDGFDWQSYMEIDPARIFDKHGRGIAMSRMLSFDDLEYVGRGNQVVATVSLGELEQDEEVRKAS